MRIVLANSAFHTVGGSETYLMTLGEQLLRLGHDVRIFAKTAGDMAAAARRQGINVITDVAELGEPADAVVSQDGVVAYELAAAWPDVPQVFVCHSSLFDFQQPPLVPGFAQAVVVLNDRVRHRVESLNADLRIVRLRQPIETQRFQPRSAPSATPRRALILSNYLTAELRRVLIDTWHEAGVEVVQVGAESQMSLSPEERIAEVDIVVGKGRAALEAMSSGRPTYLYDMFGGDGWITPDNYAVIEADGITGNHFERGTGVAQLRADLEQYDPELGRLGRELVNRHHNARQHAHDVVTLLREVAPAGRTGGPTLEAELARQVGLRWAADGELYALRAGVQRIADQASAQQADSLRQIAQASAEQAETLRQIEQLTDELEATRLQESALRQERSAWVESKELLEAKVERMSTRGKTYRRRIGRLQGRVRKLEATAERTWRSRLKEKIGRS